MPAPDGYEYETFEEHMIETAAGSTAARDGLCWYSEAWLRRECDAIAKEVLVLARREYLEWKGSGERTEEEKEAKKREMSAKAESAILWWRSSAEGEGGRRIEAGLCGLAKNGRGQGCGGGGWGPSGDSHS